MAKNFGVNFWGKRGKFSRLLAFTGILKDFTRSVKEINKIPLGLITSNSPLGKIFILRNYWGSNIFPSTKGVYYNNLPHILDLFDVYIFTQVCFDVSLFTWIHFSIPLVSNFFANTINIRNGKFCK